MCPASPFLHPSIWLDPVLQKFPLGCLSWVPLAPSCALVCNMEGRDALWGQICVWETPGQCSLVCCMLLSSLALTPSPGLSLGKGMLPQATAPQQASWSAGPTGLVTRYISRHAWLNLQWFHTGSFYLRWRKAVFHSKSCHKGKGRFSCFERSVARRYVKVMAIYTGQWLTRGHFAPLGDLALSSQFVIITTRKNKRAVLVG